MNNGIVYHDCGYALWAQTQWNGKEYARVLYSPQETDRRITVCPGCGKPIQADTELVSDITKGVDQ